MRGWRELAVALVAAIALTAALTYPLAVKLGTAGRDRPGDGQFSIWNVAWVARTLVADPLNVFNANIFYPHRGTLAYSEANLGAGLLAVPAYWATRNPYFAHNFAVLAAFVLCAIGTYYLARYLTGDRRAAAVSAICYAFCPHVFGRLQEIQLLMTFGLPFSLLAFHRMVDRPVAVRALTLGAAMAMTTYCCAYYGVFVLLMIGFAVLLTAATRRLCRNGEYWIAVGMAAATAILLILPLLEPYLALQSKGFTRSIDEARLYAANWRTYFTSSGRVHVWMQRFVAKDAEVTFPGFVALALGLVGVRRAWLAGDRRREAVLLYGGLGLLAFWASLGPAARLYSAMYYTVPAFTLMRAPARFGLVVAFSLSILAGFGAQALLSRLRHATLAACVLVALTTTELTEVLSFPDAPKLSPAYRTLASQPPGPVLEMVFFWREVGFYRHTEYMLSSTSHWMPLVNGYSDYLPVDFTDHALALASFPTLEAFKILEPDRVRYAVFHRNRYNQTNWNGALTRIQEFARYLRPLYVDEEVRLYEIVGYPR